MALVGERLDQPNLMLAMIQDITEERDAQFALIQTEKLALTGRLATSLAHEINNPLQTVIGCLGLAEEAREDDDEIDVYLAMASEELKRAASIVTRLRDLNRWSEAEQREPTDVRAIIRQALAMTRKQCEDHGIVVHTDLDVNVPDIHAIPDRLEQVFLNLTLNAIDAMPNGGTLRVGVLPMVSPDGVKIVFQDSGIGIPPEDQAHIFEAFQTTKSEGLGMGLFISQSIIEDHGGTISVRSQPDEGSTFTIQIPA
jgi:two-component system sporulation sensor kinase A